VASAVAKAFAFVVAAASCEESSINAVTVPFYEGVHVGAGVHVRVEGLVVAVLSSVLREQLDSKGNDVILD